MTVDVTSVTAPELNLPEWAAAEILDMPVADEEVLRAVIYRAGAGKWHWSVSSLGSERGELISAGIERSAAAARTTATSEIAKCIESALD
ncbi:MAG TPA: hypothetical protein VGR70_04075 [Stellaceae bacterium]|nr:hypothetical protein [Stellaceae bacterium]